MGIVDLAYNCCFAKDGEAFYKDFDKEISLRDFIRTLYKNHLGIDIPEGVEAFDDYIITDLEFGPDFDVDGVIAFLYHMMWSKADLYERLKRYEDLEEQGLLLKLPCKVGTKVFYVQKCLASSCKKCMGFTRVNNCYTEHKARIFEQEFTLRHLKAFGGTVFLTKEEAEKKLAEVKKVD